MSSGAGSSHFPPIEKNSPAIVASTSSAPTHHGIWISLQTTFNGRNCSSSQIHYWTHYQKLVWDQEIFNKEKEENRKRIAEEMEKFEERKREESLKKESGSLKWSCRRSSQKDKILQSCLITSQKSWKHYKTIQILDYFHWVTTRRSIYSSVTTQQTTSVKTVLFGWRKWKNTLPLLWEPTCNL